MKKIILSLILISICSVSSAGTILLVDKNVVQGEILEYKKDSLSYLDKNQDKIVTLLKKQIIYISFDSENESMQKKIELLISKNTDNFKEGSELLILSDGTIKNGKISQLLKESCLIDTGNNIEEVPNSEAFGIYFVQENVYYKDKSTQQTDLVLIKQDQTRFHVKLNSFKPNSVFFSIDNSEFEFSKNDISWIYFKNENSVLRQKAEQEYLNIYQFLPESDLIVLKNGTFIKGTVTRLNDVAVEYTKEGVLESIRLENIYGFYYGPFKKTSDSNFDKTEIQDPKNKNLNQDQENKWFFGGFGPSSGSGGKNVDFKALGFGIGISFQYDYLIFTGRIAGVAEIKIFGPANSATDFAGLIGFCLKQEYAMLSMSTGIAFVTGTHAIDYGLFSNNSKSQDFSTIGVPFEVQAFLTPANSFGLGLYFYGNLNFEKPFYGLLFALQFGDLWN